MKLTSNQIDTLKSVAEVVASEGSLDYTEIVVPQASVDWGFDFHPDYQFLVNTVEIHTTEGCYVIIVDEDYQVLGHEFEAFSYDF